MTDEIIDGFINRIKSIVLTDDKMTAIPLAYLMTRDMPESIKHFFDQEVELWIREEEEKFTTNERFDYDMPEVRMLIDQIFDKLKQNATFHITKFNQLLERAIKLELNYLLEPHRTLSQFLFKDNSRISTMEVYDTLKYFFRYEYYKTAISDYFNMKYMREISQDQFDDLIAQIDQKAFEENTEETTLKTIKTIMSFLSEAQEKDINSIDVDDLNTVFHDRSLEDYINLVARIKDETELSEVTFDEIEEMIRDGKIPGIVEPEVKEPTQTVGFDKVKDIEASRPEVVVDDIEVSESQIVAEEEIEEDDDEEEVEEDEVEEAVEAKAEKADVANDLANFVASQISSDTPIADLNTIIQGRMRKKVVKKLFKKNENDFNQFIDALNSYNNWKDASHLIDDTFYEKGINPYSKEAIALSDSIYLRFFPKDKYVGENEDKGIF